MAKLSGWSFPVKVDEATGRIQMVEDNDCVRQNIRLIVQTNQGERKMRPAFGAGMNRFMFQNVDFVLVNRMSDAIARSIQLWEEHVLGVNVGVMQSQEDSARVNIKIEFLTDLAPTHGEQIRQEMDLNQAGF